MRPVAKLVAAVGISKTTQKKHAYWLRRLSGKSSAEIVELMSRARETRGNKWSTLRTKLGNILGMNARTGHSIFPGSCPVMRD